jgi:hypothetical protein
MYKSRKTRWQCNIEIIDMKSACKILVGNPGGKRAFEKPKCRWKRNTEMNLGEVCLESVFWIHLAQDMDRWYVIVNTVMILIVP